MKRVAILSDLVNFDPAYSICRVIADQCKMLSRHGYKPRLLVRQWLRHTHDAAYEAEIVELDHGDDIGDNKVHVTGVSTLDVFRLCKQLRKALAGFDVVLTHDLVFQPNMWIAHLAAKQVAAECTNLRWLHWIHSSGDMRVAEQGGPFVDELRAPFPNSALVAMHDFDAAYKRKLYGHLTEQIVIVPNPIDVTADFHSAALAAIERLSLMAADVIAVYPCRLDRGKRPHLVLEVFAELQRGGWDARVVICDFHSTMGDKAAYRDEMKRYAESKRLPVLFASDLEGSENGAPYSYCLPHKAIMDLLEAADVLVHPSVSECDPLVVPEAAWKRCGLVLSADVGVFGLYAGADLYQFDNPARVAEEIAYQMESNAVLRLHAEMRKTRSLEGTWPRLKAVVEQQW